MRKLVLATGVSMLVMTAATVADNLPLTATLAGNPFAYIPPQCWTATQRTPTSIANNPCYTCHVDAPEPNFARDAGLQSAYDFAESAVKNRWSNLFVDRRQRIAAISDSDILGYIRKDNYHTPDGG